MPETNSNPKDRLMADLRQVVSDAEALLKLTASDLSESTVSLRERLQQNLTQARERLLTLQSNATERAKAAGHQADDYVHEHPWQAVAIGAGIGLVVGLLIGRR